MSDIKDDPKPDDVLRRMLAMKPKPKEKGGEPKPAPQDHAASGKSAGN